MLESEWLASNDPVAMLEALTCGTIQIDFKSRPLPPPSDRKLRLFTCAVAQQRPDWATWRDDSPPKRYLRAAEDAVEKGHPNHNFGDRAARDLGCFWAVCRAEEAARLAAMSPAEEVVPAAVRAALLRDIVGNPFRPVTLPEGPGKECWDCRGYGTHLGSAGDRYNPMCDECKGAGRLFGPCPWLTPAVLMLAGRAYEDRQRRCERCKGQGGWGGGRKRIEGLGEYDEKRWDCDACGGTGTVEDGTLDPLTLAALADALEEAGCVGEKCGECDGSGTFVVIPQQFKWTAPIPMRKEQCRECKGAGSIPHPLLAHLRSAGPHYRGCWAVDLILGKS